MSNKPNIAKRNARAFERRFNEEGPTWSIELQTLGADCLLALKMIPGQEHLLKYPAFVACVMPPIEAFHEAELKHAR